MNFFCFVKIIQTFIFYLKIRRKDISNNKNKNNGLRSCITTKSQFCLKKIRSKYIPWYHIFSRKDMPTSFRAVENLLILQILETRRSTKNIYIYKEKWTSWSHLRICSLKNEPNITVTLQLKFFWFLKIFITTKFLTLWLYRENRIGKTTYSFNSCFGKRSSSVHLVSI